MSFQNDYMDFFLACRKKKKDDLLNVQDVLVNMVGDSYCEATKMTI